jgi:hypothetical protein
VEVEVRDEEDKADYEKNKRDKMEEIQQAFKKTKVRTTSSIVSGKQVKCPRCSCSPSLKF